MAETHLNELLSTQRVLLFVGAGGVGKTSISIATALSAARKGKRVALLSIDPAKRLAAALGITLGQDLSRLKLPEGYSGSIDAAMLDQKTVFDAMVRKHAPSERIAGRILRDPLYVAASTQLSGPLEYMALAKLQELCHDSRFDLVVLDTPPDTQALDFLARPNVLRSFMDAGVMGKMLKPVVLMGKFGLTKALTFSEKILGSVVSVTGMPTLARFADFIVLMQEVIRGFHAAAGQVTEILALPSTSFILVSTPTAAASRAALFFSQELKKMKYGLDALILNKCLTSEIDRDNVVLASRKKGEESVVDFLTEKMHELFPTHTPAILQVPELTKSPESWADLEKIAL